MKAPHTCIYDRAIRSMELVHNLNDEKELSISSVELVPCRLTGESEITLKELILRSKEGRFANNERHARYLLSNQQIIPNAPKSNILFIETRWKSKDNLLWIPILEMLYFPQIKKKSWILSLMNLPDVTWVRHNNHRFAEIF